MGLADVFNEIREERGHSPGERLFSWLGTRTPKQKHPLGPGDLLRISSLEDFCPREEVLASKHEIIRIDKIDPPLSITFDIGDVFHDLYRNFYYGPMGEWRGAWKCRMCGWDTDLHGHSYPPTISKGDQYKVKAPKLSQMPEMCPECGARRPERCPRCGEWFAYVCECGYERKGKFEAKNARDYPVDVDTDYNLLTFKEWHVEDPVVGIKGHPDGWVVLDGAKPRIVDIKSISANGFKRLSKYKEGHDLQVWGYQHCCGCTDGPGSVMYVNKSPWGDHTAFVREFTVPPFDKRIFDSRVRTPIDEMRNGINGGPLPDRSCVSADCTRANSCQIADICFG